MRIGYARVSTDDQNLDLQIDALRRAGCDQIFEDVVTGASRKRPGLARALGQVNAGDKLIVWKLDRLGRDFRHLNEIADQLQGRGAHFLSISEGIDTSSTVGEVIFRLFSVFSDFERNVIVERTRAGLAAARSRGVRLGRRQKLSVSDIERALSEMDLVAAEQVALRYGVSRATLYRYRCRVG